MLDVCISSMATNYHQISGIKKCGKKLDSDNFFGVRWCAKLNETLAPWNICAKLKCLYVPTTDRETFQPPIGWLKLPAPSNMRHVPATKWLSLNEIMSSGPTPSKKIYTTKPIILTNNQSNKKYIINPIILYIRYTYWRNKHKMNIKHLFSSIWGLS